jgi:hypothetical protein
MTEGDGPDTLEQSVQCVGAWRASTPEIIKELLFNFLIYIVNGLDQNLSPLWLPTIGVNAS